MEARYITNKQWFYIYKPIVTVIFLLFAANVWSSSDHQAPNSIVGTTNVDAEELIGLFEKYTDIVMIDSRLSGDRKQGYIEGAVSLPDTITNCKTLSKQLPAKSMPVVFYCNGARCARSENAVNIALSCGYSNIFWFRGGFEEWLVKGYSYLKE